MADKKELPLALIEVFESYTDKNHILSAVQLRKKLESKYGLTLERRTLYSNINLLEKFGYKISDWRENGEGYYLKSRQFRPSEVRSLLNALNAAPFLPAAETASLSRRLLDTLSTYQRRAYADDIYLHAAEITPAYPLAKAVDTLSEAIRNNCRVSFVMQEDAGAVITADPYRVGFIEGYPYLIAVVKDETEYRYFRIDRMKDISPEDTPCAPLPEGTPLPSAYPSALPGGPQMIARISLKRELKKEALEYFGPCAEEAGSEESLLYLTVSGSAEGICRFILRYPGDVSPVSPAALCRMLKEKLQAALSSL